MQVVFDLIINKPYDPLPPSTDPDLINLVEKMLQKDPAKRPNIQQLIKIPCIQDKIKLFYQEHPNETNDFMVQKDQPEENRENHFF